VAVDNVDLDVRQGEFLAIVGRSGSGKTTLLNLLAGLDRATSGNVYFDGQDLGRLSDEELVELRRYKMSFVFQSFALLPLLSAYENVELPLRIRGMGRGERRRRVDGALEKVGLSQRAHHRPYELSGGEEQRVGVARALVTSPQVIFADEPTGELDSTTSRMIGSILRDIVTENGVTVIGATHDLSLAEMADRVVELVDGAVAAPVRV
jgi:ABC-type lipoprotein export system ATPase subunit